MNQKSTHEVGTKLSKCFNSNFTESWKNTSQDILNIIFTTSVMKKPRLKEFNGLPEAVSNLMVSPLTVTSKDAPNRELPPPPTFSSLRLTPLCQRAELPEISLGEPGVLWFLRHFLALLWVPATWSPKQRHLLISWRKLQEVLSWSKSCSQ